MNLLEEVPSKVLALFNLRKGEGKIVFLLLAYSLFQFFAVSVFNVTASAIFLSAHPVSSIPYVFIATGVSLLALGQLFSLLGKYFTFKQLIIGETIMILVATILFRLGFIADQVYWLGFALIVWHRVMSDYVGDGFTRLVLLSFDVRQSKRLFGLVSSAEIPASVLGYLFASLFVSSIHTENLLLVSAGGILISLFFLFFIMAKKENFSLPSEEDPSLSKNRKNNTLIERYFSSTFIFVLSVTSFVSITAFLFIEFAFLIDVDNQNKSQNEVVEQIAIVLGAGQFIALFVKTLLYEFLQRRYGIKASLFLLPIVLLLITLSIFVEKFFFNGTLLIVAIWVIIMLVTETLKASLYNTTFYSLLQPLKKNLKMKGQEVLGNVESLATLLSGAILAVFFSDNLYAFAGMLLFVLVAWIAMIPPLNKHYYKTLEDALKKRIMEGGTIDFNDPNTTDLLFHKLESDIPGEVIYALEILSKGKHPFLPDKLRELMVHPVPEIRKEALKKIAALKILPLADLVRKQITDESLHEIRRMAIQTYSQLGEADVVDEIFPFLDHEDEDLKTGTLVGLICHGGINGIIIAGQRLLEFVNSTDPTKRAFAAYVIGEVGIYHFYHPLLSLMNDPDETVLKEALRAAGKVKHPRLLPSLFQAVTSPHLFVIAVNALIKTGEVALDNIEEEINAKNIDAVKMRRLAHVCGRIGGPKSIQLLKARISFQNIEVRDQILSALVICNYTPNALDKKDLSKSIMAELSEAIWFLNCMEEINTLMKSMEKSHFPLLLNALKIEMDYQKKRLLTLLSFLYHSNDLLLVWDRIHLQHKDKVANALEIVDLVVAKELSSMILPMLEDFPIHQQLKILNARIPQKKLSLTEYLFKLINSESVPDVNAWTQAMAIFCVQQFRMKPLMEELEVVKNHPNPMIAETSQWVLKHFTKTKGSSGDASKDHLPMTIVTPDKNMETRLLTIEKVMALKNTGIFGETSEDLLVDIAHILKEIPYQKGDVIFNKNEIGTCMYIIYSGSVKIHDGNHLLATLKTRDFFGELALLDSEPRSATVTALEESYLLRIDQTAFYEILADRIEVTREIMKILCRRLRDQNAQVTLLKEKLKQSPGIENQG